jgi:hypothetical protein
MQGDGISMTVPGRSDCTDSKMICDTEVGTHSDEYLCGAWSGWVLDNPPELWPLHSMQPYAFPPNNQDDHNEDDQNGSKSR